MPHGGSYGNELFRMTSPTSPTSISLAMTAPEGVSRRQLVRVGGAASVAAVAGMGAAAIWGDQSNGNQVGDGSGAATPPPTEQPVQAPPSTPQSTGFASTPEPEEVAAEPTSEPAAAVDPATLLDTATIRELREHLDASAFTVTQLVEAALARIEEKDGGDIAVNAVITLNPDALDIAADLDAELAAGSSRGVLHGIPVLLKDIIATGDSMPNTAGALAMQDNVPNADAWAAALLREAGAVILGKTNLSEWSNFMGTPNLAGYSSMDGLTVNPHDLNMSASGSSSGSAAAVAAGYAPIALGAEFDGSIIMPAALCGVVGLKPTVGLIGRSGVIPIGFSRDSVGPMTKSVEDAAIALSVLAGLDSGDPGRTVGADTAPWAMFDEDPVQAPGAVDYTTALDANALAGARIGIFVGHGVTDDAVALFDDAVAIMEEAGAEIVTGVGISTDGITSTYVNSLTEFAWGIQQYFDTYTPDGPMTSFEDVVNFNNEHADDVLSMADQSGLTDTFEALAIDDSTYLEVTRANITNIRAEFARVMEELELDAFVAPSATIAGGAWDWAGAMGSSGITSVAGYPSLTIPTGTVNALPAGIHFFGTAYSEATLLGLAYALEQLLPPRPIPEYLPREE